jgi:hypothetical protein
MFLLAQFAYANYSILLQPAIPALHSGCPYGMAIGTANFALFDFRPQFGKPIAIMNPGIDIEMLVSLMIELQDLGPIVAAIDAFGLPQYVVYKLAIALTTQPCGHAGIPVL